MVDSVSNNSLSHTLGFARRLQNQLFTGIGAGKQPEPPVLTQSSSSRGGFALASAGAGSVQQSSQAAPPPSGLPRGSIVDVLV